MRIFWYRFHVLCWTALVLLLGYSFGTYGLRIEEVGAPAVIEVLDQDIHVPVPVVRIEEIQNGFVIGSVHPGARLVLGDNLVATAPDGSFRVPADPLLVNIIDVEIPHGALFVASRKGSKYYDVHSSAANNLVPENRIYFRSAEEAEAMGYRK